MPESSNERIDILKDDTIVMPFRSQVMSAAGRLPLWIQNSCRGSPSSTVVASGLTRNESRIAEFGKNT